MSRSGRARVAGPFVFRTPLLSVEEGERAAGELLSDPIVEEAVAVASPGLSSALRSLGEMPPPGSAMRGAIERYLARMSVRPTPFGLFASVGVGTFARASHLALQERATLATLTRPHSEIVVRYVERAVAAAVSEETRVHTNRTAYSTDMSLRWVEWDDTEGDGRRYALSEAERDPLLDAIVEAARDGVTLGALTERVLELAPDVEPEEARAFVRELVEQRLLVVRVGLPLLADPALPTLLEELSPRDAAPLREVEAACRAYDATALSERGAAREALSAALARVEHEEGDRRSPIQTDTFRPSSAIALHHRIARELERATKLLDRVAPPRAGGDELDLYRERFTERFGDAQVPLLHALDEDLGVPFLTVPDRVGDPLLRGLALGPREAGSDRWGRRERWMLRALERTGPGESLELSDEDSDALGSSEPGPPLPRSCYLLATVLADSAHAIDAGDYRILLGGLAGPSGVNTLTRFAAGSPELRALVEDHVLQEAAQLPERLVAEVVHQPQPRTGTVLHRPPLRPYEISFLARSGSTDANQIALSDLSLGVRGDRLVLFSRSLGKEVIPRITSAHNARAHTNLALYQLLAALQTQDVRTRLGWSWGPLASAPHLPRVTRGRLILSPARWNVDLRGLAPLLARPDEARVEGLEAFRTRHGLPRFVALTDSDRLMPLDLASPRTLDRLHKELDQRQALLEELHLAPESLPFRGPEGRFTHELIVPLTFDRPAPGPIDVNLSPPHRRSPISEWRYFRIEGSHRVLEQLLVDTIAPWLSSRGRRFFFVRYGSPRTHLRLRVRAVDGDGDALVEAIGAMLDTRMAAGWVHRWEVGTYEPETARYGGPAAMPIAEELFFVDSEHAARALRLARDTPALRWPLTLAFMAQTLGQIVPDAEARWTLVDDHAGRFAREQGLRGEVEHVHAKRYRERRDRVTRVVRGERFGGGAEESVAALLEARGRALREPAEALREVVDEGALGEVAASLVHMTVNRMSVTEPRATEAVLYDYLRRALRSERARHR